MRPTVSHWGAGLVVLGGLLVGLALGLVVFYGVPPPSIATAGTPTPAIQEAVPPPAPAPVVGAPAPAFTLEDLSGQAVSLASYRGQSVLLNFWATWCGPCQLEMPTLEKYYQTYQGQKLVVLAVEIGDPLDEVQTFVSDHALSFPVLTDPDSAVGDLYRVEGIPTTFVVDAYGMIIRKQEGMLNEAQLDGFLAALGLRAP